VLDRIDGADVGVVEGRKELGFTLEASHALCVTGYQLGKHLDCDLTTELAVFGAVDLTHATFAELASDFEMRQCRSDHA